jgi:hypothetical protein
LCAVAFGDGQGECAFGVVAVADVDDVPGVDDGQGGEVDGADLGAVVVGVGGELVEIAAQPPGAAFLADGADGDGVGAGLGEEVAAEAEHCAHRRRLSGSYCASSPSCEAGHVEVGTSADATNGTSDPHLQGGVRAAPCMLVACRICARTQPASAGRTGTQRQDRGR